ncbi:glucosyltransferase domain-containing protein [Metaclostridioides mangenotii]|uniref:glucosyltransferase domain-containing protein n=1 Tax=Metaclostridioides mangenotii TaxID=1540 RepID=UPI000482D11F|nr:glucosyltransferase domain-containing protein [Clostridioides mangenotii]
MEGKFNYQFKGFIKDRNVIYCFLSSIFFGLLSYSYFFTNNLNNYDNISSTPAGYGTGASSGRWFLSVFGDFVEQHWGNYNIPFFNGLLLILILGASSCILIRMFKVKNKWLCALIGAITVVFPPIASAMIFSYTIGYYAIAIFFVAFGIFMIKDFKFIGFILGVLLFSFSLGIYQAYYPLCASIFLLLLIKMCLDSETTGKQIVLTGIKFLLSLAIGYLLYKLFLEYHLHANNVGLSSYKGVDQMGKVDISLLPMQIVVILKSVLKLTFKDYLSISGTKIVQHSFLVMYIINCIAIILHIKNQKFNKGLAFKLLLMAIFILLLPIAMNFIVVMVPNGYVYTIMQMGFVCLFYLTIILVDHVCGDELLDNKINIPKKFQLNKVVLFSTITVILIATLNYSWQTNGNYRSLYYANRQLENYYQTLFTRIKSTENYNQDMDIYFVGEDIDDRTFRNFKWEYTPFQYGGNSSPLNTYSRSATIANYLGYSFIKIEKDSEEYEKHKNDILEMDLYPNYNSIKIVENKIFVRFE